MACDDGVHFPQMLRLLGEILREPAFPAAELEAMKREEKQALEQGRTDPQALAMNALQRKLRPYPQADLPVENAFCACASRLVL